MSQPPQKKTAMSALDQLKEHTIVVADSGDIKGKQLSCARTIIVEVGGVKIASWYV